MSDNKPSMKGILLSGTDRDLPDVLPAGISRYTNIAEMSAGNRSRLCSAFDTIVGRTVAIKSLLPSCAVDRRHRRRFLREARVTAQLQHPNTVPVYDIGVDPELGIYFTMKRISGENLLQVIRRLAQGDEEAKTAFPLRRLLDIAINVAQSLAYSHVRGVIHRDIKPENIWVGNFGEVIVLDWGVAKVWGYPDELEELSPPTPNELAERDASENSLTPVDEVAIGMAAMKKHREAVENRQDSDMSDVGSHTEDDLEKDQLRTLTNNGQRLGTPLYMSPEQVRGSQFVDDRTDMFSLGVVLYEMLTQKEPFRGRSIEETFQFIQNWDPPKPSTQVPFADIPSALDQVVIKAMAKRADHRFQTMPELIGQLQAVMDSLGSN
ncbi:MAG: serine/threonine protein kinase [Planctomycetaceae bacterium]|nr:serine/threonine protein kinase [Planctomycetaceae bacterium]